MLEDFAPVLSFFSRSKTLFEQMDSKDLEAAVESVCKEMVSFSLEVIRYCQRHPISKYSETIRADHRLIFARQYFAYAIPAQSGIEVSKTQ